MGCLGNKIFVVGLLALPMLLQAQGSSYPEGIAVEPSPLPIPGEEGTDRGRSDQPGAPGPGRGIPSFRTREGQPGPAAAPAAGSQVPAAPSTARGLGQPPRPAPDTPTADQDYPVYGPPPGLGPPAGSQRPRGGPGYPGLRGPGTGYPKHRQYANPPQYPSPAPHPQD